MHSQRFLPIEAVQREQQRSFVDQPSMELCGSSTSTACRWLDDCAVMMIRVPRMSAPDCLLPPAADHIL